MKHLGPSQLILTGLTLALLGSPGCSSMKWFHSGSDDMAESEMGSAKDSRSARLGSGDGADRQAGRDGRYPSIGRQDAMSDPEGGALRGFSPLVNGQIAGEERLSRSDYGQMMLPVDRDAKRYAELRREEAAAIEAGLNDVYYGYDRWNLSDDGMTALSHNAEWLKDNPKALLKISGHCDERGTHDYNLVLGEKRAKTAKAYLVDMGVSPKQVAIVSYGKERPFCAEHDETCHQQNRRGHMLLRK
ncbi:MAG: OmpA family protein [Nitrospiraceae bacterium]